MNKAITDGLVLMPPSFAQGLGQWSSGNGTPGSPTYLGAPNAAIVPSDPSFGVCLELLKTDAVQKLRFMGETPLLPGCYLRIRARIKVMSGNLPSVRIAAWAGRGGGAHVDGVPETGPAVQTTAYGQVVTVEAIVGNGQRTGVDMVWGPNAIYGHFGLDLTGPNGGVVRIEDIQITDATDVFYRKLMDWVDVRDYGAIGNGVTDDAAAFAAADAAAAGRTVMVPAGTYRIASSLNLTSRVRFEGKLSMPDDAILVLFQNYDLAAYIEAFGDEVVAFRKAVQALFNYSGHDSLDLCGRRIEVSAPIDVQAAINNKDTFATRRVIRNGQFNVQPGPAWDDEVIDAAGTYNTNAPYTLTNVANIANIPVGALVQGNGVGREVYVRDKNVGAGTLTLSQQLYNASGRQTFTFRRFRYVLDFSGFASLQSFVLSDIEFLCSGYASAVMLPPEGLIFQIRDCYITRPKDRGITSIGKGCQGMLIDRCQFLSNEQPLRAQDRTSICFNVNANDVKVRDNRAVKFGTFAIMAGSGHLIIGNHWFQGDEEPNGLRMAGLVLTDTNVKTTITGNYIDNNVIEWANEHDAFPEFNNEYSFGGLTITGNIFTTIRVAPWFRWLVIRPHGPGHYIHGLAITGNAFRPLDGAIDRIEGVDTTFAGLDMSKARNIVVEGNTFNGVTQTIANPVVLEASRATPEKVWTVGSGGYLPFGGQARIVTSVMFEGRIESDSGTAIYAPPYYNGSQGPDGASITLTWTVPVKGKVRVTARMDNPN